MRSQLRLLVWQPTGRHITRVLTLGTDLGTGPCRPCVVCILVHSRRLSASPLLLDLVDLRTGSIWTWTSCGFTPHLSPRYKLYTRALQFHYFTQTLLITPRFQSSLLIILWFSKIDTFEPLLAFHLSLLLFASSTIFTRLSLVLFYIGTDTKQAKFRRSHLACCLRGFHSPFIPLQLFPDFLL